MREVNARPPLGPRAIRDTRRALGLTQLQLARHLDVTPNTVCRWERGTLPIAHPAMLALALAGLQANSVREADAAR